MSLSWSPSVLVRSFSRGKNRILPLSSANERILLLAQREEDASVIHSAFAEEPGNICNCPEMRTLCAEIRAGACVALLDAESLAGARLKLLAEALLEQPNWSDLPLIIIADAGDPSGEAWERIGRLVPTGNVSLLERPLDHRSVTGAVRVALRSRRRQYALRDQLLKHERQPAASRVSEAKPQRARENTPESTSETDFLNAVINSLPGTFYVFDARGQLLRWNEKLEIISGYTAAEVARMHPLDFIAHEYRAHIAERIREVFERGDSSAEADLLCKDGRRIPHFFNGKRFTLGSQTCLIGMGIDIAQQKQTERQLKELHAIAERRVAELDAVIESMPDAVYIGTASGITKCNTNALRMLGAKSVADLNRRIDELGGKFDIRWPDGRRLKPEELQFSRALQGELAIDDVVARKLDTGEDVYIRAASAPIMLHGRIVGAVSINSDLNQRKRAEEALASAKDQLSRHAAELEKRVQERTAKLQQSVQSLEGVLYHVAHDLRAPLRAMQGFTTILLEDYAPKLDKQGEDYAQRVSSAASRMDKLIQDLLAYGRLGHMALSMGTLNLNEEINAARNRLGPEIRARNANVRVERGLPKVWADSVLLGEILVNLLRNAITFVAPGVTPQVRIQAESAGPEFIRVWVEDNGIGINPEHHERVFRVFERLRADPVYIGTGIGLAIVRKGAERMGGRAGVESVPGAGSRFWVELPAASKANE